MDKGGHFKSEAYKDENPRGPDYRLDFPVMVDPDDERVIVNMKQKVLFTGTARSGTQWLVPVLQVGLGFLNEDQFRVQHEPLTWKGYRDIISTDNHMKNVVLKDGGPYIEINCYANQALVYWKVIGGTIVHLVRDPHDVARSMVRARFNLVGVRYDMESIHFNTKAPLKYMTYEMALDHWVEQYARIRQYQPAFIYKIEDLWSSFEKTCELINDITWGTSPVSGMSMTESWTPKQRDWVKELHGTTVDTHKRLPYPENIPPREEMPEYVKALAREYGYEY
jgi:hypothetical protein